MEEEKLVMLFEAKFDSEDANRKVLIYKQGLVELNAQKSELTRQYKAQKISAEQYVQQINEVEKAQKTAKDGIRETTKAIDSQEKIQKLAMGSIQQMRAQLSALTADYDNLSEAERDNEKTGVQLQARIKGLSAELLSLESATGRNQRNVGNYAGAIEPLIQELVKLQEAQKLVSKSSPEFANLERQIIGFQQQVNRVGAQTGETYDQVQNKVRSYGQAIRGTTAELVRLEREQEAVGESGGEAFEKLGFEIEKAKREIAEVPSKTKGATEALRDLDDATGAFGGGIGRLQGFLAQTKTGLEAMKVGLGGVKGAIAATGIGLLILALGSLYAWLTKTQAGMDFVERKTKAVGAVFDVLVGTAAKLGGALIKVFTDPKQAVTDFVDALKGVGPAALAAAKAGEQIAATNQRIRDSERVLSVARAQARKDIERLKFISEDTTKSQAVRAAAAKKAFDLENSSVQQSLDLQKQRIANLEREAAIGKKTFKDTEELAEARIRLAEIEEESLGKQTELNNSLNSIRQEAADKAKQAAADAQEREKFRIEQLIAVSKLEKLVAEQKGQDTLKIEERIIQREAQLQLVGLKKNSAQRKLIEAETNAAILQARVTHALDIQSRVNAIDQAGIAGSLALALKGSKEEEQLTIERIRKQGQAEGIEIERQLQGLRNKQEREIKLGELAIRTTRAVEDARKQFATDRFNKEAELLNMTYQTEFDLGFASIKRENEIAFARIELEKETSLKILDLEVLTEEEKKTRVEAIYSKMIAQRRELNQQIREQEINDEKAQVATRLTLVREGTKAELKLRIEAINAERKSKLNNYKQTSEEAKKINAEADRAILDQTRSFAEKRISFIVESSSQAIRTLSALFDARAQREASSLEEQRKVALSSAALSAEQRERIESKFDAKQAKLERAAGERRRKIATADNALNTARAITSALATGFDPITKAIGVALAIAMGAAQQLVIASQKFAYGGEIVNGPSHAQGGVKYRVGSRIVELEGGEGVVNKRSMAIPGVREAVSYYNELGGGIRFAGVNPGRSYSYKPFYADGGITPAEGQQILQQSIDYNTLGQVVTSMVVEAVKALPAPIVGVRDIRNGVSRQVHVESRASV